MGFWMYAFFAATLMAQAPASMVEAVARRIQGEMETLGLHTQIQRFPHISRVARERQDAALIQGDSPRPLAWGKDIEALGLSGDGDFRTKALAFLGYGVQVPGGYDDLAGIELKGRMAVIARAVPDLAVFAPLPRGERSLLARLKRLESAKVAGVIVLEEGGLRPLQPEEGPGKLGIPVLGMTAEGLGGACGDLEARFKAIRETGRPASQDFIQAPWTALSLGLTLRREEAQMPNVVGVIPGRDPELRKEFIALAAPVDPPGPAEARRAGGSGAALVMELARELMKDRPRRSILLLFFGGGEEGLAGCRHWMQNPTHPLESVKGLFDFRGAGCADPVIPRRPMGGPGAPASALGAIRELADAEMFSLFNPGTAKPSKEGP